MPRLTSKPVTNVVKVPKPATIRKNPFIEFPNVGCWVRHRNPNIDAGKMTGVIRWLNRELCGVEWFERPVGTSRECVNPVLSKRTYNVLHDIETFPVALLRSAQDEVWEGVVQDAAMPTGGWRDSAQGGDEDEDDDLQLGFF